MQLINDSGCKKGVVVQALHAVERLWKVLCSTYVKGVLVGSNTSINKANKKHQLPLFKRSFSTTTNPNVKQHLQQRTVTAISSASYSLLHKSVTRHNISVAH